MIHYDRRLRFLAICLSALAGYVDALAFLKMGGFFVSFMSGNSTRLGVGSANENSDALIAMGLVGCFVVGVIAGSLATHAIKAHRSIVVLALVTVLLIIAASLNEFGMSKLAIVFMAMAMGAENSFFERNGEVAIGLTYMTGTLVKFGQRIAAAFLGGDRLAWAPYLLLWLGLISGASAGAAIYPYLGLQALWIAAAVGAGLTFANATIESRAPPV